METYTPARPMVEDPEFKRKRLRALAGLDLADIDPPILDIIQDLSEVGHCFTQQCCYGHFLLPEQKDIHSCKPLPDDTVDGAIDYRLAYLAISLENSELGRLLYRDLEGLADLDPDNVQFGCADWFWKQQVNSYVVQVEPNRYRNLDRVGVAYGEAVRLQEVRGRFIDALRNVTRKHLSLSQGTVRS